MASLPKEIRKVIKTAAKGLILVFFMTVLILNPTNNSFIAAVNTQEFISFHIRDLISYGERNKLPIDNNYYLSTGTYERSMTGGLSGAQGELFGAASGKNLIVVQIESLQNMMINRSYNGQEITPNLNALIKEQGSIYFDNYYQQIGSGNTSDAEFATNNSLLGSVESYTYQLYENNYFKGLPWILKENGYKTAVMHGFDKSFWNRESFYPVEGFDRFYSKDDYKSDNIKGLGGGNITGISDHAFFQQSMDYLQEMAADGQPFYSFLITLSSHNPFRLPDELKTMKLLPEDDDTLFGNYVASVHYADQCLGEFIQELKDTGLYDSSIVAFYGDHFAMPTSDPRVQTRISQWLGYDYDYDTMMNIPLILHIPQYQSTERVSISGGQMDFMPTICYLLGIKELDTLYLGQNLLTANSGFVAVQTHMLKGSFIKDDIVFEISRDGIFKRSRAWNRKTHQQVDITPYEEDSNKAKEIVEMSLFYLKHDVLRSALVKGEDINEILAEEKVEVAKPQNISFACLTTDENQSIGMLPKDFYEFMRKDDTKKSVLLTSNYLVEALTELEDNYSGVIGQVGEIVSVDQRINKQYKSVKDRIIPVVQDMEDCTKLEYLNYNDIAYMPDLDRYSYERILDYIRLHKPYALVLSFNDVMGKGKELLKTGTCVYVYGADTVAKKALCHRLGIGGFVNDAITNLS